MPTATRVFTIPDDFFGELDAFVVTEHAEEMPLGMYGSLQLRTSSGQTDDGTRGTWHAAVVFSGKVLAQTHLPWTTHGPHDARVAALAWARKTLSEGLNAAAELEAPASAGITVSIGAVNGQEIG